jgi:hypothetical protein
MRHLNPVWSSLEPDETQNNIAQHHSFQLRKHLNLLIKLNVKNKRNSCLVKSYSLC